MVAAGSRRPPATDRLRHRRTETTRAGNTIGAVDAFDDLLYANADYAAEFTLGDLPAPPRRHLAVVTCMDCRIDPLAILGLDAR